MRRLVICFDGTWNQVRKPRRVTNVVKFGQAVKPVASDGVTQIVYYNSGVGTGDLIDRILGGVFGRGIEANVKRALAFLSLNYEPGDEIYITGFSRGAYSARALAGVIGAAGIPKQAAFNNIERIWHYYRMPKEKRQRLEVDVDDARIRCVAVWDTVGSYGVPAGVGLGAIVRVLVAWTRGFNDLHPGKCIDIGLHGLAIDEKRRPFAPTMWTWPKTETPSRSHIEQVWFAGAHANIGGSYPNTGLSDLALVWMVARMEALGRDKFGSALEFDADWLADNLNPEIAGRLYPSARFWPISSLWPFNRPVLLKNAALNPSVLWNGEKRDDVHLGGRVHWSVDARYGLSADPLYRPRNVIFAPSVLAPKTPEEADILARIDAVRRRGSAAAAGARRAITPMYGTST